MARAAQKSTTAAPLFIAPHRRSPLHDVMCQGRYGADLGSPGVYLQLRHPTDIVTVMARQGQRQQLERQLQKSFNLSCPAPGQSSLGEITQIHWAGPDQWLMVRNSDPQSPLYEELLQTLSGAASLSDQSHGRIIVSVRGPRARDVLAKGTSVDLHPDAVEIGQCALTQMSHIGVHLAHIGLDHFELNLFRGFAESFWEWLTKMSLEVGYQVN